MSRLPRLRWAAGAAAVIVVALAAAMPAGADAHAVLEESVPTRGAVLEQTPERVEFRFNEPVETSFGAVRVFDSTGAEVQQEETEPSPDGREVGATLPATLEPGFYTAVYHVVSADSHPVSGGITFSLDPTGEGVPVAAGGQTISELLASSEAGPVTEAGFWLVRWIGFLAIALAVGSLAWLLSVWRPVRGRVPVAEEGGAAVGARLRALILAAVAAGAAASLLAIPFQGAIATGNDLWRAFGDGIPGEVASTRFGSMMLVRTAGFLALIPLGVLAVRAARDARPGRGPVAAVALATAGAVALILTPGLSGHASTQDPAWLLFPSDVVHVGAMAVWSGGLAATIRLLPAATAAAAEPRDRTAVLLAGMLRFSAVALVAVGLIALSGGIQAVAEVGSFGALLDTAFGRAVLAKIVLFAGLIGLGAANRRRVIPALVARRTGDSGPGGAGVEARRNLRIETVLVVIVLAVTAALVSYPPPASLAVGPASGAFESGGERVEYTVDPARIGPNEAHVYIFDDRTGAPVEVRGLTLSFDPPGSGDTPIEADVRKAGPGHYVAPSMTLAIKGKWTASAAIRFSRFDERVESFEVEVR